jgi:(p)ppGpp synthase/HD superfamily hydrolase
MDNALEKIKDFADKAHGDQQRKYSPEKYIAHPARVMEICQRITSDYCVLAASLLHDVVEDTNLTKDDILRFLTTVMNEKEARRTTQLVTELTDVYTKSDYPSWNRRKRKSKEVARLTKISREAQTIKYADIIDNCKEIVEKDPDFATVFLSECRTLLNSIQKGNPDLLKEAIGTVEERRRQLAVSS